MWFDYSGPQTLAPRTTRGGDRTTDRVDTQLRFLRRRGTTYLWFASQDGGFQIVKFTHGVLNHFKSAKVKSAKVESDDFSPAKLAIRRGTRVVWHFVNTGGVNHTVTVKRGPIHFSSRQESAGTYSHTFKKVGTYHLYCIIHPIMTETVIVRS